MKLDCVQLQDTHHHGGGIALRAVLRLNDRLHAVETLRANGFQTNPPRLHHGLWDIHKCLHYEVPPPNRPGEVTAGGSGPVTPAMVDQPGFEPGSSAFQQVALSGIDSYFQALILTLLPDKTNDILTR